jgi:hypothetical protein
VNYLKKKPKSAISHKEKKKSGLALFDYKPTRPKKSSVLKVEELMHPRMNRQIDELKTKKKKRRPKSADQTSRTFPLSVYFNVRDMSRPKVVPMKSYNEDIVRKVRKGFPHFDAHEYVPPDLPHDNFNENLRFINEAIQESGLLHNCRKPKKENRLDARKAIIEKGYEKVNGINTKKSGKSRLDIQPKDSIMFQGAAEYASIINALQDDFHDDDHDGAKDTSSSKMYVGEPVGDSSSKEEQKAFEPLAAFDLADSKVDLFEDEISTPPYVGMLGGGTWLDMFAPHLSRHDLTEEWAKSDS